MSRPKERKILFGLALAFAALIIVEPLLFRSGTQQKKTAAWVAHTHEVIDQLDRLVSSLTDAENGKRGYVLSGQDRYLWHHSNAVARADRVLQELRALSKDDPRLLAACEELVPLIQQRLAISTDSIQARRQNGLDVSAQMVFMERGQQSMEPVRQLVARITTEESARLKERQAMQDKQVDETKGIVLLGSLVGVGLFSVLLFLLARANRRRQQAEEELQQSNLELEERVQQRTSELARTVERLGQADEFRGKVMESAVFGLGALDLEGRFTMANERFGSLMGYKPDELLGQRYSILLSPENEAALRPQFVSVLRDKRPLSSREIDVIKKDGSTASVVFSWSPLLAQGEIKGVVGTVLDITERKRAELALRESEERFRTMADNAPVLIWVSGTDKLCTWFNRQWLEFVGRKMEQEVGNGWAENVHPDDFDRCLKTYTTAFDARQPFSMEYRLKRHDGAWRWVVDNGVPRFGPERQFAGYIGSCIDITDRKLAEERAAWLASFPETNPNPIMEVDWANGLVDYQNSAAARLLPDLKSRGLRHVWLAGLEEPVQAILAGKKDVVLREVEVDGRCFSQTVSYLPAVQRVRIYSSDITGRRQAEERLQIQLGRLDLLHRITRAIGERQDPRSIFQVAIRRLEEDLPVDFGCVCLYDAVLETLTVTSIGVRSEALALELAMTEQAHIPIDQNGLSRCVRGQLVYEPDLSKIEFPFPRRLHKGGLGSVVVAPLLVESKVFGVLVAARREAHGFSSPDCEFLRHLSEHVALAAHQAQLHGALEQAYEDLRQTQQAVMQQERLTALGQMASGIAHDINNAISPVALYTESLLEKEEGLSARARSYLQTIGRAIDDVAATVSRMREFYRQREPQLVLAPVYLNRLVEQVVDLTRARWSDIPQKQGIVIGVATELAPDLPVVMGVENEIREALTNLIFNAVDAMPKGGTLTLSTRLAAGVSSNGDDSAAEQVLVEVKDTGIGMNEDTRRRCLEPFFTTKGERGTGLGLAMVYGMVQRHSADIEIESAPGKGTSIRLSFPKPATVVSGPAEPESIPAVPSGLRILVADDDPLLLKSIRDTLEADGHVVTTANSGQGAIDAFRKSREGSEPFAVVITDLGMPYVDGRQVASTVKETSPSSPVILLTGWGQRLLAEGDVPPSVDRVLSKPPKLRELREALAHCCQTKGP